MVSDADRGGLFYVESYQMVSKKFGFPSEKGEG